MKNGAVDISSVQELVTRLSRVQELERSLSELNKKYSSLSSKIVALKSLGADMEKTLQTVSAALERARQIDPNDPPALLKRAMDTYRNFLRMRITDDQVTIYPIGLTKIPNRQDWKLNKERKGNPAPEYIPQEALAPHLIEGPIEIRPHNTKTATPVAV